MTNSIRDSKRRVARHLALNLKTRHELLKDGIALMDYVELVTPPELHKRDRVVHDFAYPRDNDHITEHGGRTVLPTQQERRAECLWAHDSAAAPNLLNLSPKPHQESSHLSLSKGKRCSLSLVDIVVPTLQEGHELLPIAGRWKFFPLPEFRNWRVDLGTQVQGWQLRLVSLSSEEESILLNVPSCFDVNGYQNPGEAFGADSV